MEEWRACTLSTSSFSVTRPKTPEVGAAAKFTTFPISPKCCDFQVAIWALTMATSFPGQALRSIFRRRSGIFFGLFSAVFYPFFMLFRILNQVWSATDKETFIKGHFLPLICVSYNSLKSSRFQSWGWLWRWQCQGWGYKRVSEAALQRGKVGDACK